MIIDVEQGSDAWREARRCKITGTRLASVMGTQAKQMDLICELIAEEATEQVKQIKTTPEMERGSAEEPFAVKYFEQKTGKKTEQVGIYISEEFDYLACSPDRLIKVGDEYVEGLEIKCPNTKTLFSYKIDNEIPSEYKWQVLNYFLVIPSIKEMSFAVYDARIISDDHKMHIVSIKRDDPEVQKDLAKAKEELLKFRDKWLKYRDIALPDNF